MKKTENWYKKYIEEPIVPLVKLLHTNGFNTDASCGHLPNPYVQIEWLNDQDVSRLYVLLISNNYKNFNITARWDMIDKWKPIILNNRSITIRFYNLGNMPLAKMSDLKRRKRNGSKNK